MENKNNLKCICGINMLPYLRDMLYIHVGFAFVLLWLEGSRLNGLSLPPILKVEVTVGAVRRTLSACKFKE